MSPDALYLRGSVHDLIWFLLHDLEGCDVGNESAAGIWTRAPHDNWIIISYSTFLLPLYQGRICAKCPPVIWFRSLTLFPAKPNVPLVLQFQIVMIFVKTLYNLKIMLQPLQYSEPLIIRRFFGMHFSIFPALQRVLSGQGTAARLKETRSLSCTRRIRRRGIYICLKI